MMEYFWYVLASMLAGVGTGLVGLPAALAGHCFGKHHVKLALAASIFGAYTELISKNGYDTVTVPLVNTAVLLALYFLTTPA